MQVTVMWLSVFVEEQTWPLLCAPGITAGAGSPQAPVAHHSPFEWKVSSLVNA